MKPRRFAELLGFRFLLSYLALYMAPFPFDSLPLVSESAERLWGRIWQAIVPWAATRALGLETAITVIPGRGGSGDTTFDYVRIRVELRRLDLRELPLVQWGFRWVNEYPANF